MDVSVLINATFAAEIGAKSTTDGQDGDGASDRGTAQHDTPENTGPDLEQAGRQGP